MQYFYESAKNESFAETAKRHMVPASSVSASVKRLERELGGELFDRSSNRIVLNEKGQAFACAVGEILEKLGGAAAAVSATEESTQISVLIKARRRWITDLIIEYRTRFPHMRFCVSHDAVAADPDAFDVIIDESAAYGDRERFLLSVEQICIKAAKSSPLAGRSLTFRQLRGQPFIITQKGGRMWQLLERAGKRCGFVPDVAVESNDLQCALRYVEAGMGLTLGSRRALKDDNQRNLVALHVADFNEVQFVYVYHRRPGRGDTALIAFLDFLRTKQQL